MGGVPEKLHTNYPSRYAIGEKVTLNFFKGGKIHNCEIASVHFTESKVRYDIYISIRDAEPENEITGLTLIEQVDSICVTDNE